MTSPNSRAGWLAASDDGRWVAWSDGARLAVVDTTGWTLAGELALDLEPPITLAISSEPARLLVVQTRTPTTRVRVLSLPDMSTLAEGSIETAARLGAVVGATALLVAGQDTMTALDLAELQTTKLTVRGPIEIVTPFTNEQVLVVARGKLEAWSLKARRPTHRLGLTLAKNPRFAGLAASGTLLWAVAGNAPGAVTAFRLSDGTRFAEATLGGVPIEVYAIAASPVLVALVQPDRGGTEVVAVDLSTKHRRVLPFDAPVVAVCVVGETVVAMAETGIPMMIPLAGGPPRPLLSTIAAPPPPHRAEASAAPAVAPSRVVVNRLDEWRAQVQTAVTATVAAAPANPSAPRAEEPRTRSRAELCAWFESARARNSTAPPPPPYVWNLTALAHRFAIDLRSRTLIALLYAAWLDGEGRKGLPVALVARALGNDELAWVEALAQGRVGRLGWIRSKHGRTRLHPELGRFLDEATPRVKLVAPGVDTVKSVEPPATPSLWREDGEVRARLHELATACGTTIAEIDLDAIRPDRFARVLGDRLLEARLHGAVPVLVGDAFARVELARLEGGVLLAPRAAGRTAVGALPLWPTAEAAS